MVSEESKEFTRWRRDLEDAEAFKANPDPWKRRYVPPPSVQIKEVDPRDRD